MCGISGIITLDHHYQQHEQLLGKVMDSQHSRGPDYRSKEVILAEQFRVYFGHNRLSVIDLSEQANQPMWDPSKRFCIVYNGEIYNYLELKQQLTELGHVFKTQSDTEVILAAFSEWHVQAVERFNGMFAFSIFDAKLNRVYLFRDRFAVKPLYYAKIGQSFYFASSSQVLAKELKLDPNLEYLYSGLNHWRYEDQTSRTAYQGLQRLLAGHYLTLDLKQHDLQPVCQSYYDLRQGAKKWQEKFAQASITDCADILEYELTRSVTYRLRADVPIGISLSGGLDSTSIAAIANQQHDKLIGLSFASPNDRKSEGSLIAEFQKKHNFEMIYIDPKPEELLQSFWATLAAQDAPFPSMSVVAQNKVYQTAHEAGLKVLLGGQGGDEALLGYRKFFLMHFKQLLAEKKFKQATGFFTSLLPMLFSELPRAKSYFKGWQRRFSSTDAEAGVRKSLVDQQIDDILCYSLPTLLRYEDRNSMSHSIESRLPFVDYELVEMAIALPEAMKMQRGYGKWILRKIMAEHLPKKICFSRYKRGFDVSHARWIHAGLGKSLREVLVNYRSLSQEMLKTKVSVDEYFSDCALLQNPRVLHEAISLVWYFMRVTK